MFDVRGIVQLAATGVLAPIDGDERAAQHERARCLDESRGCDVEHIPL